MRCFFYFYKNNVKSQYVGYDRFSFDLKMFSVQHLMFEKAETVCHSRCGMLLLKNHERHEFYSPPSPTATPSFKWDKTFASDIKCTINCSLRVAISIRQLPTCLIFSSQLRVDHKLDLLYFKPLLKLRFITELECLSSQNYFDCVVIISRGNLKSEKLVHGTALIVHICDFIQRCFCLYIRNGTCVRFLILILETTNS